MAVLSRNIVISKFGYDVEFASTPSTLPPGQRGMGGSAMCAWCRINGSEWRMQSYEWSHNDFERLYFTDNKEEFMELLDKLRK